MEQLRIHLSRAVNHLEATLKTGCLEPAQQKQKYKPARPSKTRWSSNLFHLPKQNLSGRAGQNSSQYNLIDVQKIIDLAG